MIGGVLATPSLRGGPHRSSISIWRRAVKMEVSPCRVCVFGPSVDTTTCQHDGGDEENAGHRSGVCGREERLEIGVAHAAVAWGKKAATNEAKVPSLMKRWKDHDQRERAITTKDSQKPAYSVLLIFALPIFARKLVGTAILRRTTESDFPLENCTFRPVRSGFTCD
jgi:hypothetical protein